MLTPVREVYEQAAAYMRSNVDLLTDEQVDELLELEQWLQEEGDYE